MNIKSLERYAAFEKKDFCYRINADNSCYRETTLPVKAILEGVAAMNLGNIRSFVNEKLYTFFY